MATLSKKLRVREEWNQKKASENGHSKLLVQISPRTHQIWRENICCLFHWCLPDQGAPLHFTPVMLLRGLRYNTAASLSLTSSKLLLWIFFMGRRLNAKRCRKAISQQNSRWIKSEKYLFSEPHSIHLCRQSVWWMSTCKWAQPSWGVCALCVRRAICSVRLRKPTRNPI